MLEPGTRTSLCIALILLILGMFAVGRFVIFPLTSTYWANRQEILDKTASLHRYQKLLDEESLLQQRFDEHRDNMHDQISYLKGPTTALAGTELQDRVRYALAKVEGEIESTEILTVVAVEDKNFLDQVGLRARISVTNGSLGSVLYDLEFGEPYLFVNKLVISKSANDNANGISDKETLLNVAFDIFGVLPK